MNGALPDASNITVRETLGLLDGQFETFAAGIAEGRYVFWIGSGISMGRVEGLHDVVARVLTFLQERADASDSKCPHARALAEALQLAELTTDESAAVDVSKRPADWPVHDTIVRRLVNKYSALLDIRVEGPDDYLLWEAVDVVATYSGQDPDCEHLALAVLALEGVVPAMVSANWDGLIEAAVADLANNPDDVLDVVILPSDTRDPRAPTRLIKLHGCAIRAGDDPAVYRELLIGRQSQITRWPSSRDSQVVRELIHDLATTRQTFMLGLSAQDSNIQDVFATANDRMEWPWPNDPPAHVFSGQELGPQQVNLLRVVYESEYGPHESAIKDSALIRAYAKPLLTALVLEVLARKLKVLIGLVEAPHLGGPDRDALRLGIEELRTELSAAAGGGEIGFMEEFIDSHAQLSAIFQTGKAPSVPPHRYRPLTRLSTDRLSGDPSIETNGVRELAAALGILGRGQAAGLWAVASSPAGGSGAPLKVATISGNEASLFFVANGTAAVELEASGTITPEAINCVIVHSTEPITPQARSPKAPVGRTGQTGHRHVGMASLLSEAESAAAAQERFRYAAAL